MAFSWSESQQQYRDGTTGRFVPSQQITAAVDTVIQKAADDMAALTVRLQEGTMTLAEWQAAMMDELKPLLVGAAAMGRGGWAQMTQADFGWTGYVLRQQYVFLRNFAHDIATGKQPMDGRIVARARMYAGAVRFTFSEMKRRTATLIGLEQERNMLGAADRHCAACVSCSAQGWVPIGSLPSIGARTCMSNCRCSMQYRTVPAQIELVA